MKKGKGGRGKGTSNLKALVSNMDTDFYHTTCLKNDPDAMVLTFLQTTYEAAANSAQWDRAGLDYAPVLKS